MAINTDRTQNLTASEGHLYIRKADERVLANAHRQVMAIDPDDWEEVAISELSHYSQAEYGAKVSALIHERYTLDDEAAILRKMLSGPTDAAQAEYAEYNAFAEECKARAKAELSKRKEDPQRKEEPQRKEDPTGPTQETEKE